jgi:tryptophan synthase alpha chain
MSLNFNSALMSDRLSPNNSLAQTFRRLQAQNRAAFIPFFSAGDPNLAVTEKLLLEAETQGADLIEIGVPFSDPVADGPVIQASYNRALTGGFRTALMFEMVRRARQEGLRAPLVCMCAYTLAFHHGVETFVAEAKKSGFSAMLFPDLPLGLEEDAAEAARKNDLGLVLLAAPGSAPERRKKIASRCTGFLYYVSLAGVTGARSALPADLEDNVRGLREISPVPVCVGFGISTPDQAAAVARQADGVIVGSALVRLGAELQAAGASAETLVEKIGEQTAKLASAVHSARN